MLIYPQSIPKAINLMAVFTGCNNLFHILQMNRPAGRQSKIIRYQRVTKDRTTVTKASQQAQFDLLRLKRDVKRSSIMTRLFNKKNSLSTVSRGLTKQDQVSKANGFQDLKKIYKRQQTTLGRILKDGASRSMSNTGKLPLDEEARMKQGLLGEYKYYEKMEKAELIEKLIALEYLTQKLFKRNKYLEDRMGNATTPTIDMNKTFF